MAVLHTAGLLPRPMVYTWCNTHAHALVRCDPGPSRAVPPLFCTAQVPRSSDAGTHRSRAQRTAAVSEPPQPSYNMAMSRSAGGRTRHVASQPPLREVANQSFSSTPSSGPASDWSANHRDKRPRSHHHRDGTPRSRDEHRPALKVDVPEMHHRAARPGSTNSSQEALLNPRPYRSQHTRQRYPKRSSQTTLRGRGAKRDPPRHSRSKKSLRPEPSRGWSLFAPSPPKTPKREHNHRDYQTLESSPRSHHSPREHRSTTTTSQTSPESSRSQNHHHRSRQHERQIPTSRQARSRTPNTAVRRVPDRRFAVLAATNQALENVRREAFAQPSPPPRRERLRRYEGVTVPTSQIPFNWDCVSNSQTSAGQAHGESSGSRQRRLRR
ncbi:hypothetical protein T440DRAFT_502745 [Plenodomus tracheiphilus IPT5]|uniref:Uncharacterized protein n=1 Tax=Plenodomus tracheiphilus IPT5 TaxID=1408161 RepID=A0A6A7ANX3_9PLEO|nr:hypothetical protein T440DRAFT_502745 [Plenodomus tracheiphilus IPT5]